MERWNGGRPWENGRTYRGREEIKDQKLTGEEDRRWAGGVVGGRERERKKDGRSECIKFEFLVGGMCRWGLLKGIKCCMFLCLELCTLVHQFEFSYKMSAPFLCSAVLYHLTCVRRVSSVPSYLVVLV